MRHEPSTPKHHYLKGKLYCNRCRTQERINRIIYTEVTGRNGNVYYYFLCRGRQEGICDLPYLPVEIIERAIAEHFSTLALTETEADEIASTAPTGDRRGTDHHPHRP
jgi:hypothetical protein